MAGAWHGQNLRDILVTLGYDVDTPWRELPKKTRDWILFTDEQPTVGSHPDRHRRDGRHDYMGTFSSAERHVLHTFANTQSAMMSRRVLQYMTARTARCATASGCGPSRWR